MGRRDVSVCGREMYTLLHFKMGNQQGPVVLHMELCSMLHGSLN